MENIVSIQLSGISHTTRWEMLGSIILLKRYNLGTQCRLSEYHLGFTSSVTDQM